jgi:hypothetical protein
MSPADENLTIARTWIDDREELLEALSGAYLALVEISKGRPVHTFSPEIYDAEQLLRKYGKYALLEANPPT